MRVGIIAPPWVPVPPPAYGGTETVVDNLARGLRARGVEVRLFTVGTSTCPVPSAALFDRPVAEMNASLPEAAHVLAAYEELADVDVVHDHTLLGPVVAAAHGLVRTPVVATLHGPFTPASRRVHAAVARHAHLVAISHAQAAAAGGVPVAAVIHHGIDLRTYRAGPGADGHVVFVGRMSPDKGVHRAVRVARRAGRPLRLATKIRSAEERAYYRERVAPLLTADDPEPAELPLDERLALLRGAAALLNPIRWPEPFGLVMAEALASATPVLASPCGAAPEIVDHARTGFLCADEDDMVRALDRVPDLRRRDCRDAAEQRFSLERMAGDHERLYRTVLERPAGRRPGWARPATGLPAAG